MHCDAEFDAPVGADDGETLTDDTETQGSASPTVGTETAESDQSTETKLTTWEQRLSRWLGPDGWIDNSLTIVLAIGAGFVIGPLDCSGVGVPEAVTETNTCSRPGGRVD
jgi:hypothetical protein